MKWKGEKKKNPLINGDIYISHYPRQMSKMTENIRGWEDGK